MFKKLKRQENVCRLCLVEEFDNSISIFDKEKNSELKYSDIAIKLMNIQIKEDDNLPKIVCGVCASNLLCFYRFQQKCKSSEYVLNDLVHGQSEYVQEGSDFEVTTLSFAEENDDTIAPARLSHFEVYSPMLEEPKCEKQMQCSKSDLACLQKLSATQNSSSNKYDKKFECEICSERFTRRSHVTIHIRRHTNQNPYGCDDCPAAFKKSSDLGRHRKIHSDHKDYICEVCGLMFKRSSDVKSHMNSHTGRKPYKCRKCLREYSAHSSMMKHCRKFGHL